MGADTDYGNVKIHNALLSFPNRTREKLDDI